VSRVEFLQEIDGFSDFKVVNVLSILRKLFEEFPETALNASVVINVFRFKI
jgi:hypothetical protein